MVTPAQTSPSAEPHIPVLLGPILDAVSPVSGTWIDGTFGAGGYTRALLDAGAARVIAIDRDPDVFVRAKTWSGAYGDRLQLVQSTFAEIEAVVADLNLSTIMGLVLDIGVSSMQIDQAERGFSFMQDGPLDMRMSQSGISAGDIVNGADEGVLADLLFLYGEERASRRIAKAIIRARGTAPIETTAQLVDVIESVMPKSKPGQAHPATRSFQALRIAVNDELGQLVQALEGAEAVLSEGGILAVVTFHSLEDRIVKRFLQHRAGGLPNANRYAPETEAQAPRFERIGRKAIGPTDAETAANPRARSAKLRLARRLSAPAGRVDPAAIGLPKFNPAKVI